MIRRVTFCRKTACAMSEAAYHSSSRSARRPSEEPRAQVSERWQPSLSSAASSKPLIRPSEEYLELSSRTPRSSKEHARTPKLLVLDLNGALIYRSKSGSGGGRRASYPRPYLPSFLQYLFGPERDGSPRPWDAFVWSSAQPDNVRAMVELGFGKRYTGGIWGWEKYEDRMERENLGSGKLLGVWARDKMGLTASQYNNKTQTTKDLRKVYEHFAPPEPEKDRWSPSFSADNASDSPKPWPFSDANCLLLDDSPLKAVYQPFNQLVIPEFDRQEYRDSIDGLLAAEDGFECKAQVDSVLLGVVGILDSLKTIDNIPAWIRAGGLFPQAAGPAGATQGTLKDEHLPSHPDFTHWYASAAHLSWWIARGKEALRAKGIELEHGLVLRAQNQQHSKEFSSPPRNAPRSPQVWRSPGDNGNGQSSRGNRTRGAAGIVGVAAMATGVGDEQEEETTPAFLPFQSTSPPLHEAVQSAIITIRRVMSTLPPLHNISAHTLLDACDLLEGLIPEGYIPPSDDDEPGWAGERQRILRVCKKTRQNQRPGFDPSVYANPRPVLEETISKRRMEKKKESKGKRRARREDEAAEARAAAERSGIQVRMRTRSTSRVKQ